MTVARVVSGPIEVADLPDALLSRGVHAFTTRDAAEAAGVSSEGVRPALARLLKNKLAFSPARGLYIPIPPEFRSWGAVPATWFVDSLMQHLGRAYYVGFLSAAELYGVAHQKPQTFQVAVDRDLRDRAFGRVRLRFITQRDAGDAPVVRQNTPTGTLAVSTPAMTALDLAARPLDGGGIHNVATVLIELHHDDRLHDDALAGLMSRRPVAATRRVGWILERFTDARLDTLAEKAAAGHGQPSLLDGFGPRRGHVDRRWNLRLNSAVEPDV